MDKFKRYLGLLFCILLFGLLIPISNPGIARGPHNAKPTQITAVDYTVANILVVNFSSKNSDWKLWQYATSYLNGCPKNSFSSKYSVLHPCSDIGAMVIFHYPTRYWGKFESLAEIDPSIVQKHQAAFDLLNNGKTLDEVTESPEFKELNFAVGMALLQYLSSIENKLALSAYLVNLGVLVLIVFSFFARRVIGSLIWWPFSLTGKALKRGARLATKIHKKI